MFEAAHGKEPRLGLWGTAWLVYTQPIAACVVDWSSVEKLAANTARGAERVPYEHFRRSAHDFVAARVKKYLSADRYLELPLGLSPRRRSTPRWPSCASVRSSTEAARQAAMPVNCSPKS